MLNALWRFRHFILTAVMGEFRARFARSRLGLAWSVLHPLAQAAIFTIVLSEVLGARLGGIADKAAYPVYLMAGLAGWGLFTEILNRCLTVFIEYGGMLKKIAFPRLCLPLIVWGSALVNHLLLLVAMVVIFLFFGHYPSATWVAVPLGILLISLFAFGLGVLLGIINVFSRDVGQVMSVIVQLWFWLTPIVYPYDALPAAIRNLVALNPMAPLVRIYQDAILFGRWPDLASLAPPAAMALALFALSFVIFRRASPELVDAL